MKKILMILLFCMILPSCTARGEALDIQTAAREILDHYEENAFVRADEDFIETNFGTPDYIEDAVVYYTENGDGTEFGVFSLEDTGHNAEMERLIRDYIASEREAVESLAALYPATELSERLDRFDHATIGAVGTVTYYVIGDETTVQRTVKAMK